MRMLFWKCIDFLYLFNNKCFVISETVSDKKIVDIFSPGLIICPYNKIIENCVDWLNRDSIQRQKIADTGHLILKNINIKIISQVIYPIMKEKYQKENKNKLVHTYYS